MLHILFLILKIIGIILAVILGILVLLICTVLFIPVCYQGSGKCDGTLESLCAIMRITWLFRLLQINVKYENGNLKYSVRIAWKKIVGGKTHEKSKEHSEVGNELEQTSFESVTNQETQKDVKKYEKVPESIAEEIKEESFIPEGSEEKFEETEKESEEKSSFLEKIKNKTTNIKAKLHNICDKIKYTIKNICDKLKALLEKKDKVMQFIQDRNHIKAFKKLKKELFKLLKRLRPKTFILKGRYGFEDPSLTGRILAVLSVVYPFVEDHIEVIPDFEKKVLEGRVVAKGRIYIIHFLCLAWNLIWCKQIRMLYKDVRNFKL